LIVMEDPPWPPPPPDAARHPLAGSRGDDGAILGGVAHELGMRTGVDPLWYRIGFVVLTPFNGLGALLYLGLWLILRGRRRSPVGPLVVAGMAVIAISCVVLLDGPGTNYLDSPWTLVFVLAGIAVALWQPRTATEPGPVVGDTRDHEWAPPPAPSLTEAREVRPRSALGRWTLAAALVVGAGGAIGYQLADDGLHPERWLGAAAVVCGIGITIGAWRGRALWLVVPALLFAGSGFVAGHAARAGIDELDAGSREFRVDGFVPRGLPVREDLVAGEIEVTLVTAPAATIRSDLRVGLGLIELVVDDDLTVEVRAHVYDGDIVVNGVERPNDGEALDIRVGSGATPDFVIDATVSTGKLEISRRPLELRDAGAGERRFEVEEG
jgi:phage shock protein PspC (stress-responsive transcriptional regulator)